QRTGTGIRGYFDVGFEMAVDDSWRRPLRKRGSASRLRRLSLRATAAALVAEQDGRIRCGGGAAGSPPFTAGALAAGAAVDDSGRPAPADYGEFCGDSRRSGGRSRQRILGGAPRYVVFRNGPDYSVSGLHRDVGHARTSG